MAEPKIIVLNDADELYVRAAEEIAHIAGESICTHGEFTLCLSGGSTPAATYDLLATRFHLSVDWKEVQFFWGDKRHTASLFPGDPAIHETQRMVVPVEVDAAPRKRLTITPPVINNAQRI